MRDRIVAAGVALLVLAAAAYGALTLLDRPEPDPAAEAAAVVDDFLSGWERWDAGFMARYLAAPDEELVVLHREMREALAPTATAVDRGPLDVDVDAGRATAPVTVTLDVPGAGTFAYDTQVAAQRAHGEWHVEWRPSTLHPELRPGLTWTIEREDASRAPILGHDGTPLTSAGELHTIGLWPERIEDPEAVQAAFDTHVPSSSEEVAELLADELNPDWFYPVATLRTERFETVWNEIGAVPGVVHRTSEQRLAPTDAFALHVLGAVEVIDADRADELGPPYAEGDEVGRYGLEAALEERLAGSGVVRILLTEADGDVHATVHEHQPDAPEPVTTTLDVDVQRAVEHALVGVQGQVAVVVVDVASGAVRASASRPLTGYNRAFEGRYPPGSTFKIVTAAAALADGWDPEDEVACPASATLGGRRISNLDGLDLGTTTLRAAFAASCNTTFASLAVELGADRLAEAAGWFGFSSELDLVLPAAGGTFPEPADDAELAAAAIGQGRVESSPLHLASVAAAAASGGWSPPALLSEAVAERPTTTIPAQVTADLGELMRAVVSEGTGSAAAVAGEPVAGKTGSAEAVVDAAPTTHAWFVGARGDLAVAVLVEGGGSGGQVAAPIAGRIFREAAAARD